MTNSLPPLVLAGALAAGLCGQTIVLSAPNSAPVDAVAVGAQQLQTLAAGALALQGAVSSQAAAGGASTAADVNWFAQADASEIVLSFTARAQTAGIGGQAVVGPVDVLVSMTNPTPVAVTLTLSRFVLGTAGGVLPMARLDVDNDNAFELTESTTSGTVEVTVAIGPLPTLIRCFVSASATGAALTLANVGITMRPATTLAGPLAPGCSTAGYYVRPRFDGDLEFGIDNVHAGSAVAVFGLATQPLFLGSLAAAPGAPLLPCVVLPRPDLLVFLPTVQPIVLAIPPAARPLSLYSQAVHLTPIPQPTSPFGVSGATWVSAF